MTNEGAKEKKPSAHWILTHRKEEIIEAWESRVRKQIIPARNSPEWLLRDHVPMFLDSMAESLNPAISKESACEDNDSCTKHGEQRAEFTRYKPRQLVEEYALLREAIFETVRRYGQPNDEEIDIILRSMEDGIAESVQAFSVATTTESTTRS